MAPARGGKAATRAHSHACGGEYEDGGWRARVVIGVVGQARPEACCTPRLPSPALVLLPLLTSAVNGSMGQGLCKYVWLAESDFPRTLRGYKCYLNFFEICAGREGKING